MHDDDNDSGDKAGQIFYSGINPEADRAEYALPRGEPALQDGEVELELDRIEPAESGSLSRRALLGLGIGMGTVGLGAAYVGGVLASTSSSDRSESASALSKGEPAAVPGPPAGAEKYVKASRELAVGSMEDLIYSHVTFIMIVETCGGRDPTLWHGMERLFDFVKLDRGKRGFEIAQRLLKGCQRNPPPTHLRHMPLELEEFVAAWKKVNR